MLSLVAAALLISKFLNATDVTVNGYNWSASALSFCLSSNISKQRYYDGRTRCLDFWHSRVVMKSILFLASTRPTHKYQLTGHNNI